MSLEKQVVENKSTSFWLKKLVEESKSRDPIDVLNDLDVLVQIIENRLTNPFVE
jgi:hypothetical protein